MMQALHNAIRKLTGEPGEVRRMKRRIERLDVSNKLAEQRMLREFHLLTEEIKSAIKARGKGK